MPGMKMPEWYTEAKEKMGTILAEPPPPMESPPDMERLEDLSYLFAEYSVKGHDVLLHIFPKSGPTDVWSDGHYINRCRSCRAEVPMPNGQRTMSRCARCGHTGLVYIPGRAEEASSALFPDEAEDLIREAINRTWMGDVALERVPELNAYVVQFQQAKNTANTVGLEKFVRQTCKTLDDMFADSLAVVAPN